MIPKIMMALYFASQILWVGKASANGQETHGGGAVYCKGTAPVMLDYYNATLPEYDGKISKLVDVEALGTQGVIDFITSRLRFTSFQEDFVDAVKILRPIETWTKARLKTVLDTGLPYYLPKGCIYKQVAVRQGTSMFIDRVTGKDLTPGQIGILIAHEALYLVSVHAGKTDSSTVRSVMRELLKKDTRMIDIPRAARGMVGISYLFEKLAGRTFSPDADRNCRWQFGQPDTKNLKIPVTFFGPRACAQTGPASCNFADNTCLFGSDGLFWFKIVDHGNTLEFHPNSTVPVMLRAY